MFKYIQIGEVLKPYKTKGELLAMIDPQYHQDVAAAKALFISVKGFNVPYFIEYVECEEDTCYIKFEEFNNPEDVKKVNGYKLSLRECDIDWTDKNQETTIDFSGFMIMDETSGQRLQILRTEQYPQQIMAIAKSGNAEYLIPLNEHFIVDIDPEVKLIKMELPQGMV